MIVVLVVSGEEQIGRHVRSVLGSQGWWVTSASDREEALRESADRQPALVIVDCEVEGAAELVRTFGSKNGGPGVLLLEPPDDADGAFHAFEAGADQILSKPPRAKPLLEAAERVMSLPHQSAGAVAADMGEKFSADDIFGEVLTELGGASAPGTTPEHQAVAAEPVFALEMPTESGEPAGADPARQDESSAVFLGELGTAESEPGTTPDAADLGPALEATEESEVAEEKKEAEEVRELSAVANLEDAPQAGTESPQDADELESEEEASVVVDAAEPPAEPDTEIGSEIAEVVPEDTETAEPEIAEVREISTAQQVESDRHEILEVSSAAFEPALPGDELDQVETMAADRDQVEKELVEDREVSSAASTPEVMDATQEEPVDFAEARIAEEWSPAEAGSELEDLTPDTEQREISEAPEIAEFEDPVEEVVLAKEAEPAETEEPVEPVEPEESKVPPPPARETPIEGEEGRFGQYRLDERIAVGGMAEVWRASMLGMEGFRKTVAIKKILPHLAENSDFVTMFIEEAKLAAQLSHENLVEIYDLGKIGESFFIAMEYVDGKDLRGLLNRLRQNSDRMPIGLALLIAAEVARGLEYAHTREDGDGSPLGLVHRDVSPRNVLIGHDGRVRLCDFGVAKAVTSVIETQIGALKGKLQYMSPEQASGSPVDNRSDIYSLGSVMYEMISGRRLYEADNELSLLDAVRAGNFDDPRKLCPGLPQEVRRILIKALAKKPSARYQRAGALEQDLRQILRTLEPAPAEQVLSAFVRELFVEPARGQGRPAGDDGTVPSVVTAAPDEQDATTRSFQLPRPATASKVARFWWGVAAGLVAAGLVALMLKLLLG